MSKSPNQKLKLLYIMQMLYEKTDEEHPLSMESILAALTANGISAERKSIYSDIDSLRAFGMDIKMTKSKPGGYFLASREFEVPELKLLVDSVQASQFITHKKTMQLIKKLEGLCSVHEAQLMRRQVYVSGRIKHMNESIYYGVDAIHNGIAADRKISFRYFDYDLNKKKVYRHDAKHYEISPFALTWNNENYYMIGYDHEAGIIKHYRVDRMEAITLTDEAREGKNVFDCHDTSIYTRRTFEMFAGEETIVDMEFKNRLIGVVLDRFGKETIITKRGDSFLISVPVAVSPQFFAWMFGFGADAKIIGPPKVCEEMKAQLLSTLEKY